MRRLFEEKELVVATHNAGKAKEIAALLGPFISRFYTANDLDFPEPEETEDSFVGNAALKALSAAQYTGKAALADDSGFCVEALDGAPGIYSARWAENEHGERNFNYAMERVRQALVDKGVEAQGAKASFVCVLSLAWPDGHVESFEGRVHGQLCFPPRGDKGFGYDPIFVPDGYEQSFAEIDSQEKQAISHRGKAFEAMIAGCFKALVA